MEISIKTFIKQLRPGYVCLQNILVLLLITSCGKGGLFNNIDVRELIDPDKVAPEIEIQSNVTALTGDSEFELEYKTNDNIGGTGVRRVVVSYSPDGQENNFRVIGNGETSEDSKVSICVPNKNHPLPTFKVTAYDKSGNSSSHVIGNLPGQNFTITPSNPLNPEITSADGLITNKNKIGLIPAMCPQTRCSSASLKYESFASETYLLFADDTTAPLAGSSDWKTCSASINAPYMTSPDFTLEGPHTFQAWSKTTAVEFDGVTNLALVSSASKEVQVIYDITPPVVILDAPLYAAGGSTFTIKINATDLNGIKGNVLQFAEDGVTFTNVTLNDDFEYSWTPPKVNQIGPRFKSITTDNAGNITEVTSAAITIDSISPPSPVFTRLSPYINSTTTTSVVMTSCFDTDEILMTTSPIAPSMNHDEWASCVTDASGVSTPLDLPVVEGIVNVYVWAKDRAGNISLPGTFEQIYDATVPTLAFGSFGNLYKAGDEITLSLTATDLNGISSLELQYSLDGLTYTNITNLDVDTPPFTHTWTIPAGNTSIARFKLIGADKATPPNSTELISDNFTIDNTAPEVAHLLVEGTVITGKSYGTYRISECEDIAGVFITRGSAPAPLEDTNGWQTCSEAAYSITTTDFVTGVNNLRFWVKDGAGNIATTYLAFATTYKPPVFTVVDGPTISTDIASITISFCEEENIKGVLFNETGIRPESFDTKWQTCDTAIGHLKSEVLSPGPHTLKAYFKYGVGTSDIISFNPIDVFVNFTSTLTWNEPPSVNRPQTIFTLATCTGIDKVLLNKSTAPLATDPGWVDCSTATGALVYNDLSPGDNTINAWFKDASDNVFTNNASTVATFIHPSAYLVAGSTIQTPEANLTITDCKNISHVLVALDSAALPDASDARWVSCTTASNAIIAPPFVTEGAHAIYTWFKYTDNYVLTSPDIDNVVYDPYDITPPDLLPSGQPVVALTLENGYGATPHLLVKNKDTYDSIAVDQRYAEHTSRALFTINTCTPTGTSHPKEDIKYVLVSTESDIANINSTNEYWQECNTLQNGIQSASIEDGSNIPLYFYYKDLAGNISGYNNSSHSAHTVNVRVDTTLDVTPPPRPYVEITTPPTLRLSPAQMWVKDDNGCFDVDQVYVNTYSRKYNGLPIETLNESAPLKTAAGWQNCKAILNPEREDIPLLDTFNFPIILAGSYTLNVWFKDAAGNINPVARQVSFVFDPLTSEMPNPVAYWSFDRNHFYKKRAIDVAGNAHLSIYPFSTSAISNAKLKEGMSFSGNRYGLTHNTAALKPTVNLTMSAWLTLTNGDTTDRFIAGNKVGTGGYALVIEDSYLRFYVNGRIAQYPTSSYTTGMHHVTGTSDGRYVKLYVNGELVHSNDYGSAQNINQGTSVVFAVGVTPDATTNFNTASPNYFNGNIDELVVWSAFLDDRAVFRHYVDGMNKYKVNEQRENPAPTLASASFHSEFMQNALLTVPSCAGTPFVYVDETTHPPTADSHWIPCTTINGGIVHADLRQGYHQLKVWTKDQYDNISEGYALVDTTMTDIVHQAPPELYYTLDNEHIVNSIIRDLFSGLIGDNIGIATSGASGVGFKNQGFMFNHLNSQVIESLYASPSQLTDKVTISSWARLTANDNRSQTISGNTSYSLYIDQASNELGFKVYTADGIRKASVTTNTYLTGYHNVLGTYDGQEVVLYLDGRPVSTESYPDISAITSSCMSSFSIGAAATCNSGASANTHFSGGIDEVIVWNDALTEQTVYDFFNGQDTVPPLPVEVEEKSKATVITIPVATYKAMNCDDVKSVYVTLGEEKPNAGTANWQTCSTNYKIKTPLLDGITNLPDPTVNTLYFWFRDEAGNISDTPTVETIAHIYDFTVPDPLAYWTFDYTNTHGNVASDVFGNHHASKFNMLETVGTADEAVSLSGAGSYAEAASSNTLQLKDTITLSTWFKVDEFPVGAQTLMGNYNNGGYSLGLNGPRLVFRVRVNNANAYEELSFDMSAINPALDLLSWQYVAAVYDEGEMKLFVNAKEVATRIIPEISTGVKPEIVYENNNSFVIGAAPTETTGAAGEFFVGSIDETSLFLEPLTDTVFEEIYKRGNDGDKTAYKVVPPEIPIDLNIIYYNALVSRANLTVTDCSGLNFIIITDSKFPPSKNDEDWQMCNTMTGGLLSKELSTKDAYGKLWTKDVFGNISRSFKYVPIETKYDLPIQRPAAHWTFDNAHYSVSNRTYVDRIGAVAMNAIRLVQDQTRCDALGGFSIYGRVCYFISETLGFGPLTNGVLNRRVELQNQQYLRVDNTASVSPKDKLSVATWVHVEPNYDPGTTVNQTHIVSNYVAGKGYAIRAVTDPVNPRIEFVVKPAGLPELRPYLETKNFQAGWHLIIGTYDAATGEAKLYVDGIFTKMFKASAPAQVEYTANGKFMVGSRPQTNNFPIGYEAYCEFSYAGGNCGNAGYVDKKYPYSIDEVIVWNKVLTGLEASSLYHNGADVLYPTDIIAPVRPTLSLENSRPTIHTNRAYFSVSNCNDISGVLVNEGTRPDKQDDRWQVCRTRLGSFGIRNLEPGGHTITLWFKDLAGNVTEVSQDSVVFYEENPTPRANAYWPMEGSSLVSHYTRDVVSTTKEHELLVSGLNRENASAGTVTGRAGEGVNLVGSSHISMYDGLQILNSSKLVRPVNYLTVGGWYYFTAGDQATKVLVDNLYNEGAGSIAGGYKLYKSGDFVRFEVGLDLAVGSSNRVTASASTLGINTGWNHVLGIWTGSEVKIVLNNSVVGTSGQLPEENYIRYIDNSNGSLLTYLRFGAESERSNIPSNFLNAPIDEQAIWGFDLNTAEVKNVFETGRDGNLLENFSVAPDNVDNAFVYYYDTFGSRVRVTMLSCKNTPYLYVGDYNTGFTPASDASDWVDCSTLTGGVMSAKLTTGASPKYVGVWSKNAYGAVSSIPARLEVPVITSEDDIILPKMYYSFNNEHVSGVIAEDLMGRTKGSLTIEGLSTGVNAQGFTASITKSFNPNVNFNTHFINGFSAGFWAYINNADNSANTKTLLRNANNGTPPAIDPININIRSGVLNFQIRRALSEDYSWKSDYTDTARDISTSESFSVSYPINLLPVSGWYFVTATYDKVSMNLYINGDLVASDNAARLQNQSINLAPVRFQNMPRYNFGQAQASESYAVDELMMWDFTLTQEEIIRHYMRIADKVHVEDNTAPTTAGINLSVVDSIFSSGSWSSNSAKNFATITSCNDIAGIYMSANNSSVPRYDDNGWIKCNSLTGGIELPNLTIENGSNIIYVWVKDSAGNVNAVPISFEILYNLDSIPTPVAYLPFDNVTKNTNYFYDFSPNHLRVESYGARSENHRDADDNSLVFDGRRSYLKIEGSPVYKPTDEISLSYWYNVGSASTCIRDRHIFGTGNKTLGYSVRLDGSTPPSADCSEHGALIFEINLDGTRELLAVPASHIPANWVHFTHVFDGRRLITYMNGGSAKGGREYYKDLKSVKTINYPAATNDPLIIAASPNGLDRPGDPTEYAPLRLNDFVIFDKAIKPYHVAQIMDRQIAGTKVYVQTRTIVSDTAELQSRVSLYEPSAYFTYGSRIKATISNCSNIELVLINKSGDPAPSATSTDWQTCNTGEGGILSAPIGTELSTATTITPALWLKSFNGEVLPTTIDLPAITIKAKLGDIPRPAAYWTFNNEATKHQSGSNLFDFLGQTITTLPGGINNPTYDENEVDEEEMLHQGGYVFNGTRNYITARSNANTNSMDKISVSAWAKLKKGERGSRTILSNLSDNSGVSLATRDGKLEFSVYALEYQAGSESVTSAKIIYRVGIDTNSYADGWHHVVGTYDGRFLKMFIDGVHLETYQIQFYEAIPAHLLYHNDITPWLIGAAPGARSTVGGELITSAGGSYYNSAVDEVSIFNQSLSASSVYYLYLYGTQYKAGGIEDNEIAPVDPGIALTPSASVTSTAFAYFTTPTCNPAGGEAINSFYVKVSSGEAVTTPDTSEDGWQYCSLDSKSIISPLLNVGTNTITIWIKDNDDDISTPITYTLTYLPPAMPNPLAYWSFNHLFAGPTSEASSYFKDRIGLKNLRLDGSHGYQVNILGKQEEGYQTVEAPPSPVGHVSYRSYRSIDHNWSIGLNPEKNFAVSLWYRTGKTKVDNIIAEKEGAFSIKRTDGDYIETSVSVAGSSPRKTSTVKMAPNSWNHIALSRIDRNVWVYLNSKLISSYTVPNEALEQSPHQLRLISTEGMIDDVSIFNHGLTEDQVLYNYYLAAKASPSTLEYIYRPTPVPAPVPNSYWTFNNSDLDESSEVRKLKDITGNYDLNIIEDTSVLPSAEKMKTGQVSSSKVAGEGFFIKRREDEINFPDADGNGPLTNPPETNNIVGAPEFLESESTIGLGENFSMSAWVNFTKENYHPYQSRERYTVIDQWGPTAEEQSFRLYNQLESNEKQSLVFEFRTASGVHRSVSTESVDFNSWLQVVIVKKKRIVSMFINNIEVASTKIANNESIKIPASMINTGTVEEPVMTPSSVRLRIGESNMNTDEHRFEGFIDEVAIWTGNDLSVEQLSEIHQLGKDGYGLNVNPRAVLSDSEGNITPDLDAKLTLNSCNGNTHVYVGRQGDTVPDSTDAGWQTCTSLEAAIQTGALTPDSLNKLVLWFRNGNTISPYSFVLDIVHESTDVVAPEAPVVTLTTSNPTTSVFSRFTLNTCSDTAPGGNVIAGVYVGFTGSVPTATQKGWVSCTTSAGGIKSPPLKSGVNSISFWFKDNSGNIGISSQTFSITYNSPGVGKPQLFLPFTESAEPEFNQLGKFIRDSAQSIHLSVVPEGSASFGFSGVVGEAAQFLNTARLEGVTYNPELTNKLSVATWINIENPASLASIINQWSEEATRNRFSFTIDNSGRLCFAYQTVNSSGDPSWSTSSYRHACSLNSITFGEWTHVAMSRDGSVLKFYINGELAGIEFVDSGDFIASTLQLRVAGQHRGGMTYGLGGNIDELALYAEGLSDQQVEKLYSDGYNGRNIFNEVQSQYAPNPYIYFNMNDNTYAQSSANELDAVHPVIPDFHLVDINNLTEGVSYTTSNPGGLIEEARQFNGNNFLESSVSPGEEIREDLTLSVWTRMGYSGLGIIASKWSKSLAPYISPATPTKAQNQFSLYAVAHGQDYVRIAFKYQLEQKPLALEAPVWNSEEYNQVVADVPRSLFTGGRWNHIAVIRKNAHLLIYINGILEATKEVGLTKFIHSTEKLKIGGQGVSTSGPMANNGIVGDIDDFAIWNKAIDERHVAKIYKDGQHLNELNYSVKLSVASPTDTITPNSNGNSVGLTVSDCSGATHALVRLATGGAPASGDSSWVDCTTIIGGIRSPDLSLGNNNIELWLKNGSAVGPSVSDTKTIRVQP